MYKVAPDDDDEPVVEVEFDVLLVDEAAVAFEPIAVAWKAANVFPDAGALMAMTIPC